MKLILVAVATVLLTLAYMTMVRAPRLMIADNLDVGVLPPNSKHNATIKLRNPSWRTQRIKKITPGCGCMVTQLQSHSVPPRGELNIPFTISTSFTLGARDVQVVVETEQEQLLTATVAFTVESPFHISPATLQFLGDYEPDYGPHAIKVAAGFQGMTISNLQVEKSPLFSHQVVQREQEWVIEVSINRDIVISGDLFAGLAVTADTSVGERQFRLELGGRQGIGNFKSTPTYATLSPDKPIASLDLGGLSGDDFKVDTTHNQRSFQDTFSVEAIGSKLKVVAKQRPPFSMNGSIFISENGRNEILSIPVYYVP